MKIDKLVRMVNQIAEFFAHEGPVKAAASTADHLKKFWDPSMRGQIIAAVAAGSRAEAALPGLSQRCRCAASGGLP